MTLPPCNNRDTSIAAAESIAPKVSKLAARVYRYVCESSTGATCWEIEQALCMSHQTASARLRELSLNRCIVDSTERRRTGSGRQAIVWVGTDREKPEVSDAPVREKFEYYPIDGG
jgi:hypothetical protein